MSKGAHPESRGSVSLRKIVYKLPGIKIAHLGKAGPLTVFEVNGPLVRNRVWEGFCLGGNSEAYPWIPPNEIWLERLSDMRFTKLHELHEFNKMKAGWAYEKAHDSAENGVEQEARKHPDRYGKLWAREVEIASAKRK
jgi:hypothetical protein